MSETKRITRTCTINELNPILSSAIRAHIKQYQLGEIEPSILMCCETTSVQQKKGFFGGSENAISAAIVTPQWLIWAESHSNKIAEVNSALLSHIEVHDYAATAMGTIAPDTGMNINGRYTDAVKTGQAFIGLGADEGGGHFRQVLRETMAKVETDN